MMCGGTVLRFQAMRPLQLEQEDLLGTGIHYDLTMAALKVEVQLPNMRHLLLHRTPPYRPRLTAGLVITRAAAPTR